MKTYNKIEMAMDTSAIDMSDHLMVLEKGDILVVTNLTHTHFSVRKNEVGSADIKVSSAMATALVQQNIAKVYESDKEENYRKV